MVHYYIGMLRKLNARKLINLARLVAGYRYSRFTKQPRQFGLPFSASIEPTTSCNLRCPQCPSGLRSFSRATGMLDFELYKNVVSQLEKHVHTLTLYFQGEPYLHPEFTNLASYASSRGIYTVTSTNGHFLTEENARRTVESGLDKLIISVDGVTQDSYEKYRVGGRLDKLIKGTEELLRQKRSLKKRTPHVVWQFVVFKSNESQVKEVRRLGKKIGVDEVRIKTAQIYDYENGHQLLPGNEKYSRYEKGSSGRFSLKNRLLNHCWRMWQGCVITWDGKIVPCCFDKDAAHRIGNLEEQSFSSIWHSKEYDKFRSAVLTGRKEIDICMNCSEGTRIWA